MKTSKIILASIALAGTLVLTSCFPSGEQPTRTDPSTSSDPGTSSQPTPTPLPTQAGVTTSSEELSDASLFFPDVAGVGNFSKEDVQLALWTAYRWSNTAVSSAPFINGDWQAEGFSQDIASQYFRNYLTPEAWVPISSSIDTLQKGREAVPAEEWESAVTNIQAAFFSSSKESGGVAIDTCTPQANKCLIEPPTFSDFNYQPTADGSQIQATYSVTAKPVYLVNGVQGVREVKYDYIVNLSKNPTATPDNGDFTYIITGYKSSSVYEPWSRQE